MRSPAVTCVGVVNLSTLCNWAYLQTLNRVSIRKPMCTHMSVSRRQPRGGSDTRVTTAPPTHTSDPPRCESPVLRLCLSRKCLSPKVVEPKQPTTTQPSPKHLRKWKYEKKQRLNQQPITIRASRFNTAFAQAICKPMA